MIASRAVARSAGAMIAPAAITNGIVVKSIWRSRTTKAYL